jgi:hypothetical protein
MSFWRMIPILFRAFSPDPNRRLQHFFKRYSGAGSGIAVTEDARFARRAAPKVMGLIRS